MTAIQKVLAVVGVLLILAGCTIADSESPLYGCAAAGIGALCCYLSSGGDE